MKKVIGYVVSVAGIVVMALGFGMIDFGLGFLESLDSNYVVVVGIVAIVLGIVMSLRIEGRKGKIKGGEDEVPIYEGVGKKRRIVGYRKE